MTAADALPTRGFTAKGLATRDRILRCAADVLLSGGLQGFNVEKVRQAASVSGSQINHYFGDRGDLIRAVLRRQLDIVLDFHRQPALGGLDTFEDWQRWADLNVRYLRKIGYRGTATYHALAGQLAKTDEDTRKTFAEGYWRWITLLEDGFHRMRSAGLLRPDADPRHLAVIVVGIHQGAGLLAFTYRQEWPLVDATQFLVNYIRMFAKDPRQRRVQPIPRRRDRPRGRPPQETAALGFTRKGLATRSRILEGAAQLILQHGVNGTSLDDVRAEVGVSGSQMSHYFATKQDLVRQVIAARTDFVLAFHAQPEMGGLRNISSLHKWAELCWLQGGENYLRNGCVYGSLTSELLEADDEVLDDIAAGYDRWLALFYDGMTAMVRQHDLRDDADPRHLAAVLVIAHQGSTMLTHITSSSEPFKAAMTGALNYVGNFATSKSPRRERRRG